MDLEGNTVCCGCLYTDRNVQLIDEHWTKKCFTDIVSEIQTTHHDGFSILLCWQCAALLKKFTRFKHQILQSYQILQEYGKLFQNFTSLNTNISAQKLEIHNLNNIEILPYTERHRAALATDDLKVENLDLNKEEVIDNISVKDENGVLCNNNDNDDTRLIEVAKKSKELTKRTAEKRKKKKKRVDVQNSTELNTDLTKQRLEMKEQYNIAIQPSTEELRTESPAEVLNVDNVDLNSEEILDNVSVKEESGVSSNNYDDDDRALIEVAKKTKKFLKWTSKKRKKKRADAQVEVYTEVELTRDQIQEERRLLACKDEYINAMFRCDWCLKSFPNVDDLKDHIHLKHDLNASKFKCKICKCAFATEVSYSYHVNKHTIRYQCVVCLEQFTSKRGVLKHYNAAHCRGNDEVTIQKDSHPSEVLQNVDNSEENTLKEEQTFPCEFCAKTFRWKTSLRKHIETHRIEAGQKRKPYCEPCNISFTTTSNLQKHVKTSSKHQIQLKLRKLNESFPAEVTEPDEAMAREQQVRLAVNGERAQHACAHCGARYQWRGNLLRHLHTHAARAKGELVCEPCNRTFSSIATYQQHMKISKKHVSENDFKYMCSDCGKKFANKTRLKDHVDWEHLKNFVHTCPICQKVFKSHTSLYLHKQVVHIKAKPEHLCDHCGKPFPNQAKLRSHITALHSGEAPYKCGSCAARFSWHSCLSRHVRRVHRKRLESS